MGFLQQKTTIATGKCKDYLRSPGFHVVTTKQLMTTQPSGVVPFPEKRLKKEEITTKTRKRSKRGREGPFVQNVTDTPLIPTYLPNRVTKATQATLPPSGYDKGKQN